MSFQRKFFINVNSQEFYCLFLKVSANLGQWNIINMQVCGITILRVRVIEDHVFSFVNIRDKRFAHSHIYILLNSMLMSRIKCV